MRGENKYEGLAFNPLRAKQTDNPKVRENLLPGGNGGASMYIQPAEEYNFWNNRRMGLFSTLTVSRPATNVFAAKGMAGLNVLQNIPPVVVGNIEDIFKNQRRQDALNILAGNRR